MDIVRFENNYVARLKKLYRFHIEEANFATDGIPKHILLDHTRNIHSYLIFCKKSGDAILSSYWNHETFSGMLGKFIKFQFSTLDRPLFLIIEDDDGVSNVVEGNVIREYMSGSHKLDELSKFILNGMDRLPEVVLKISNEL